MSEFSHDNFDREKPFDIIPRSEVDRAIELANSILPDTLLDTHEYHWTSMDDKQIDYLALQRGVGSDFSAYLMGVQTKQTFDPQQVHVTKFHLHLNEDVFVVGRELHDSLDTVNGDDSKEADKALFELGMLKPEQGDWDDFIRLLEHGRDNVATRKMLLADSALHPNTIMVNGRRMPLSDPNEIQ